MHQGWFRALPVRRWLGQRRQGKEEPLHLATYLLVQASQRLWLAGSYDVYQQFTWVSHAIHTWPPTAVALAVVRSSRERPGHPDRVRLRCPKSFAPADYSGRTSWWGTSGRTVGYVLVVRPVITGTSAASCHNLPGTKAIRRAHFRLGHQAPGRGGRQARTVSGCLNSAFSRHFSTFYEPSVQAMDTRHGATSMVDPDDSPRSCSTNNLCR